MKIKSQSKKAIIFGTMTAFFCFTGLAFFTVTSKADTRAPETFYISNQGNDSANGTSVQTPWKSIDKVNQEDFVAGDKILFERGDTWENTTLKPKGSGNSTANITLSAYGNGDDPKFEGNAKVDDVISLHNQQHWSISDLDVSNQAAGFTNTVNNDNGSKLGDYRGIHITGADTGELSGFDLSNLYVHDVTGEVKWIGGQGTAPAGVQFGAGWDKSKRTGGIVIEATQPQGDTATIFKNVTLKDSKFVHDSYGAFIIKQWNGSKGWAYTSGSDTPPDYSDNNWKPFQNITVSGNYFDQSGGYNCDGIYLTDSQNALIENNVVKGSGTCGIEMYLANHITVQNNEVYNTQPKVGGQDSNAIDTDKNVTNAVIQYNYIHNNGDGMLICGFDYNSAVIRYNLFKDNTGLWLHDYVAKGALYVLNNIFYNTLDQDTLQFTNSSKGYWGNQTDSWLYANNIFYNTSNKVKRSNYGSDDALNHFTNNDYYGTGVTAEKNDKTAITKDPSFATANPTFAEGTSVATRTKNFDALKLQEGSPLINTGKAYIKDPTQMAMDVNNLDYGSQSISNTPNIGLFESTAPTTTPIGPSTPSTEPSETSSSISSTTSSSNSSSNSSESTNPDTTITKPTTDDSSTVVGSSSIKKITPFKVIAKKAIYRYDSATFKRSNRIKAYAKQPITKAPIFTVVATAKSTNGSLRYKLRDGSYITAKSSHVIKLYLSAKATSVKVINSKGTWTHSSTRFTKANIKKHLKKNTIVKVKKVTKYKMTTRYQLVNGQYITGNRQYVEMY